jgi:hypothetical protein
MRHEDSLTDGQVTPTWRPRGDPTRGSEAITSKGTFGQCPRHLASGRRAVGGRE